MVLVGLRKIEYTLIGACIYVIIEYLLFVEVGLSITYKEALILFIILILLVFKPNGIFSLTSRKI
ncbi:MAG: hypothetical protein H6767_02040 [Candidatus Peribacteria bacterium]|nr:MAG: hypothetical protein H6767_02040 [Candidatus Peribacteria bacterium]